MSWPSLLVLDGLDEVAAPPAREALVSRVADFLVDVSGDDMDVLIVATTRPRGYAGEFRPERYDHLTLTELTREAALGYASRLADARHGDDPDMRAHVLSRIREAADEELTSRMMQTPLQVTIMSLLLESRARVPQHRHGLFDAYYETMAARCRSWASLLACGNGATLTHRTAAELHGLYDEPEQSIHVTLPVSRRIEAPRACRCTTRRGSRRSGTPSPRPLAPGWTRASWTSSSERARQRR